MNLTKIKLFGIAVSFCFPAIAYAESSAKELFMGLDGDTTQVAAKALRHPGPAKPFARPKVLGLQTTVYQLFEDGGVKAVSPNTTFQSGSRIRLGFNANRAGFLYVVNVGSSGKTTLLFPSSPRDNNQVQPGLVYQIPQQTGKSIRFDTTAGKEQILVVLAESRLTEFEYSGQKIALSSPNTEVAPEQRIAMASNDLASSSKDLFVEDDGVFQTVVFNPASEASNKKKPLVMAIKLKHQ
jgi:hypothetical protein